MFFAIDNRLEVGSASDGKDPVAVELSSSTEPNDATDRPSKQEGTEGTEGTEATEATRDFDGNALGTEALRSTAAESEKPSSEPIATEKVHEKPRRAITLDSYAPSPIVSATSKRGSGSSTAVGSLEGAGNPFTGDGNWKSSVFVIDRSGSMDSWNKFPRVVKALQLAIESLKHDQTFTVILFNDSAYPYEDPLKLLDATHKNKQAIARWLNQSPTGGGTNPVDAMLMAIELQPERILLLSDGEFDPLVVDAITQENARGRKKSRIDCVGLAEEIETLQQLANRNHGIYYQAQ